MISPDAIDAVAEARVREKVAREIEDAALAVATTDDAEGYALTAAILQRAAAIARGGAA